MIAALLAAGSVAGLANPSLPDPQREALVVHSLGAVVLRIDPDGFVQARGCDGALHPVGNVRAAPQRIRIRRDGSVAGFAFAPDVDPAERQTFQGMMRALGYSDWNALSRACLPTGGVSATQDLERSRIGSGVEVIR